MENRVVLLSFFIVVCWLHICSGADIEEACSSSNDCSPSGSECTSGGKCQCKSTHYLSGANTCTLRQGFEGACTTDDGCLYSLNCTSSKCQCSEPAGQYFDRISNTCNTKQGFDGACTVDDGCLYSLKCTSSKCQCTEPSTQYFDNASSTCKTKIALGSQCTAGNINQCADPNSDCANALCTCKALFYQNTVPDPDVCAPKQGFDGDCTADDGCLYSLNCTSSKCQCTEPAMQYFDTASNTCKTKQGFDGACTADDNCLYDLKCVSSKCQCQNTETQYFDTASNTCKAKIALGSTCTNGIANQCVDPNAECTTTCECKSTFYKNTNSVCTTMSGFDGNCPTEVTETTCLYSLQCTDGKCQCPTPTTHFFDSTAKVCKQKIELNNTCDKEADKPCKDMNAKCTTTGKKCVCNSNHYNKNDVCTKRILHEETCSETGPEDQCITLAECKEVDNAYKCMCPVRYDSNDKQCDAAGLITTSVMLLMASLFFSIGLM